MNNIFVAQGEPIKRFVKTVEHPITGWRLDPDTGKQVEFILSTPTADFDYDTAVLEFYSDKDFGFFKQRNRYLIQAGLVKEYVGEAEPVDTTNLLSDEEIYKIATISQPFTLTKRLNELTSPHTVKRILAVAEEVGRPAKTIAMIKARAEELEK